VQLDRGERGRDGARRDGHSRPGGRGGPTQTREKKEKADRGGGAARGGGCFDGGDFSEWGVVWALIPLEMGLDAAVISSPVYCWRGGSIARLGFGGRGAGTGDARPLSDPAVRFVAGVAWSCAWSFFV